MRIYFKNPNADIHNIFQPNSDYYSLFFSFQLRVYVWNRLCYGPRHLWSNVGPVFQTETGNRRIFVDNGHWIWYCHLLKCLPYGIRVSLFVLVSLLYCVHTYLYAQQCPKIPQKMQFGQVSLRLSQWRSIFFVFSLL